MADPKKFVEYPPTFSSFQDQSAQKLSRLEILRRTTKYICFLQELLKYLDSEEGLAERRRRRMLMQLEEAEAAATAAEATAAAATAANAQEPAEGFSLRQVVIEEENPPVVLQVAEEEVVSTAEVVQVGEVVAVDEEEPTYIYITLA